MVLLLESFLKRENVGSQRHNGLILFDYTKECQFSRDWDEITLNARGIVFEEATGKLIARPYKKFFNLSEPGCTLEDLPKNERFLCLTKVDGSMGIIYYYQGDWHVNTRGSFHSDQAKWAKAWLDANVDKSVMVPGFTYCVEIVYPENRIVIDYGGKSFLCLLGIINNETGKESDYSDVFHSATRMHLPAVEAHLYNSLEELFSAQKNLSANEEGFVITYVQSGFKFKLKGDAYCKIHRLISDLTPLAFWRAIDWEGTLEVPLEYLVGLPEEFRKTSDMLKELTERLHKEKFAEVVAAMESVPETFRVSVHGLGNSERRNRYEFVMEKFGPSMGSSVLFYLDGKIGRIKKSIHDDVRPTGNKYDGMDVDYRIANLMNDNG